MPFVVGTAGHIDHGKTALVRALTGQDTDRLKEEKERGISIDLGFARLDLGNGNEAGVVDVPGHERFIRNMLAGAHAIDLALFVVAADDGVMPQSEEHLDFLHLLGVPSAIVVLTKADLAAPERLTAVREEIEILADGTLLEQAPIAEVSSVTGSGIEALRALIAERLAGVVERRTSGRFRLPVDRAFVLHGHGVVVTGTATAGEVRVGDAVAIRPGSDLGRVRSIQIHGRDVAQAARGQRVALNLGGIERTDVRRGLVVVDPMISTTTERFDAMVEIRPLARKPLASRRRVRLHLGTSEVLATLVWLGGKSTVAPKERAHAQIVTDEPIVAFRGDRFVLRRESADRTLGGGTILHPLPPRHRARDEGVPALLDRIASADVGVATRALLELERGFGQSPAWVAAALDVEPAEVIVASKGDPEIEPLPSAAAPELLVYRPRWTAWRDALLATVKDFHAAQPLLPGVEMEPLRAGLPHDVPAKLFRELVDRLAAENALVREESIVHLPTHRVTLRRDEEKTTSQFEALLESGNFTPPDVNELARTANILPRRAIELLRALERAGKVAKVAEDLYYPTPTLDRLRTLIEERIRSDGALSAATFRDAIQASRKFAIALLEYFDRTGFTMRIGDQRKLRKG